MSNFELENKLVGIRDIVKFTHYSVNGIYWIRRNDPTFPKPVFRNFYDREELITYLNNRTYCINKEIDINKNEYYISLFKEAGLKLSF